MCFLNSFKYYRKRAKHSFEANVCQVSWMCTLPYIYMLLFYVKLLKAYSYPLMENHVIFKEWLKVKFSSLLYLLRHSRVSTNNLIYNQKQTHRVRAACGCQSGRGKISMDWEFGMSRMQGILYRIDKQDPPVGLGNIFNILW